MDQVQKYAKEVIQNGWKDVRKSYTVGFGFPLSFIEERYPFVSKGLGNIRELIIEDLPIIIYQTLQSPPGTMAVVVPFQTETGPLDGRVITLINIIDFRLLGEFAKAIWISIDTEGLPHPALNMEAFEKQLTNWTDPKLFSV
jgi:hypothetical protein